ncbi:minor capsid protein [Clostridium sp. MSJ-11]|uniref:Minor capsid protein n=1 Tax=Clostridium mobile TaxID=2841512 RepID=A0ABS6EL80_9CLOT|nr:minor capsid protein [Clostridium mobile]MBU5485969.1 minor capsid protein [Clostridium mobile]
MDKLYEQLNLQFTEEGFNKADEKSKEAYKIQVKHREELLSKIGQVLLVYTILDSKLFLKGAEKLKLRSDFSKLISNIAIDEFKKEKTIINNILEEATEDKYYSSTYILNIGLDFKLQKITDKQIKSIVDTAIDGELWSDRLWTNKKDLEKTLNLEIERFLQGKTNVNKINNVIKDRFNQNAFNTRRLVQTETARCQNQVNDVFAEDHSIEEQMYTSTLDNATSKFCREHDGKRYKINDPNKPSLPAHPFCRSCYINIPFKGWKPKVRKDNITKEYIPYINYKEWLEQQDIK